MKHSHSMPFGAQVQADGTVRFQLWAPAAATVELCLHDAAATDLRLPMQRASGGWYGLDLDLARPGCRYHYLIDGKLTAPDPASRFQPEDVAGPSAVVDPTDFDWPDVGWAGRPWEETVLYELHVGAFTTKGSFAAIEERLDHLVELGINAIELMPIGDFPGRRNWGYDGVLPYAPDNSYGSPAELKSLVAAAHGRGLAVFLDVVYNHFGPEGNYLHAYAPQFFTDRHHTPWGAAINFDGAESRPVRDFFVHNALYWLEEYQIDGLRFDAVHAIIDDSEPDILIEIAERVRSGPGSGRYVHLVLENDDNEVRYLERKPDGSPRWYDAQWNDDFHHALHVAITGEVDGYYADYADRPQWYLGRCLTQGFAYQGEPSPYRSGQARGEPSHTLPVSAFVAFLQNHDQIGNRAFGERIDHLTSYEALRATQVVRLLAPSPPLLFMGEEFGATTPFLYFCDFSGELAEAVKRGRREEFARFERFATPASRTEIPDPNSAETFERSRLDWGARSTATATARFDLYAELLRIRRDVLTPRLRPPVVMGTEFQVIDEGGLLACWRIGDGSRLTLIANLSPASLPWTGPTPPIEHLLYEEPKCLASALHQGTLPPWSAAYFLEPSRAN
jgi:maltooligosyltrehalose trehalohydrolase